MHISVCNFIAKIEKCKLDGGCQQVLIFYNYLKTFDKNTYIGSAEI